MKLLICLVLFLWIEVINAEEGIDLGKGDGVTFSLLAANPDSYDHSVGGGSFSNGISVVKGNYYACDVEVISLLLKISTDSSFKISSTAEWEIDLFPQNYVTVKQVLNNCVVSMTDAEHSCTKSGASVVPSFHDNVLSFKQLKSNTKTVIRIDLIIGCDMDCECPCWVQPGVVFDDQCGCYNSAGYPRQSRISSAQKVYQDINPNNLPAMFFNDYKVDGNYHQIPLVSVNFTKLFDVLVCLDFTGCSIAELPGKKTGCTYKDRDCKWYDVSCDDGDPCTIDQCIPPYQLYDYKEGRTFPPNCIHIDTCGSDKIPGYCYDYNTNNGKNWNCSKECYSDADCEYGGICYYIDYGYCEDGEGSGDYCFREDGYDCSKTCGKDSDCGDSGKCLRTILCSSDTMGRETWITT
jgi:hypothetical protein